MHGRSRSRQLGRTVGAVKNPCFVVMGVAGSGKTLIGSGFARSIQMAFVDGDDLHPPENVHRMAAGIPLTDADRAPWLEAIARRLEEAALSGRGVVVACSALRRAYRDVLRGRTTPQFIFLKGARALIASRLESRRGHYMPASLLDSQFATLEEPVPDEKAWVVDIREAPDQIIAALTTMARGSASSPAMP